MPSIGDRLREARTRRGVDFDEVEAVTKVRARYLRALEAEQFDLLPGPTFVRTFLRTYADYLGLDARLLVEEYRTQYEPSGDDGGAQSFAPGPVRTRERSPLRGPFRGPGPLALVAGGALGVLLLFLVIGLVGGEPAPERPEPSGAPSAPTTRSEGERRSPRPRRRRRAPTSVTMRVAPGEPTYLCVDDGQGQVRYEGTLEAPRTFRGRRLRINMGRTSARVTVNGRSVPIDRTSPDPVAFAFRPGARPRRLPPATGPCT